MKFTHIALLVGAVAAQQVPEQEPLKEVDFDFHDPEYRKIMRKQVEAEMHKRIEHHKDHRLKRADEHLHRAEGFVEQIRDTINGGLDDVDHVIDKLEEKVEEHQKFRQSVKDLASADIANSGETGPEYSHELKEKIAWDVHSEFKTEAEAWKKDWHNKFAQWKKEWDAEWGDWSLSKLFNHHV
mmetsp:Transcript_35699/g.54631  ORF Transcript_35699/g.54631 Transcript_35699/m.54631 type:complete len:183 (-) Transcript_35699:63-611(-)|eukprot:CAMPEP_0170480572 /NCGR_PEP_ID=MMETSP0208-20121228/1364_1 /TAXON_ID=197538 /ORGANISM="Strombidium inclinatum, Strain S3" /LENGTH=182 /DNA_ID=CAMNT_0010753143 /DNA_START=44 /DNA_END=592 /DNA_ORIENTATION=-